MASSYFFTKVKKDVINPAFEELKKKGYIAELNISCCGSCGIYEADRKAEETNRDCFVYTSRNDHESAVKMTYPENEYSIHFKYGSIIDDNSNELREVVGLEIFEELEKAILNTKENRKTWKLSLDWDKDPRSAISLIWKKI
jgi:hypothetical protein